MENNNEFNTTTLSGQMVISQTESGVDMIQGLPDNPVPEQVKPFSCWGHMHMLSNGMFDFISRIRKRNREGSCKKSKRCFCRYHKKD